MTFSMITSDTTSLTLKKKIWMRLIMVIIWETSIWFWTQHTEKSGNKLTKASLRCIPPSSKESKTPNMLIPLMAFSAFLRHLASTAPTRTLSPKFSLEPSKKSPKRQNLTNKPSSKLSTVLPQPPCETQSPKNLNKLSARNLNMWTQQAGLSMTEWDSWAITVLATHSNMIKSMQIECLRRFCRTLIFYLLERRKMRSRILSCSICAISTGI